MTMSPQAKRAETDPRQGTPTRAPLQPPDYFNVEIRANLETQQTESLQTIADD